MPRGSSSRSGPAPDPNALRRDRDEGEWTVLPASGREGDPPEWPLSEQTSREAVLWEQQWRRPQAIVWERNGQALEVAMFVRALVDAESPKAVVAARTLVRQQMDSLGLSVPGLRSNRWRIVDEAEAKQQMERRPAAREAPSTKERLTVVQGGAAAS